jgi:outer membrane protein OmpA-like peptidoglycan-associated protein
MIRNGRISTIRGLSATLCLGAGILALAGCVNNAPLDDLSYAAPAGSPFDAALYRNYSFLAHSFGEVGAATNQPFDQAGSMSLAKTDSTVAGLANSYAAKAVSAAKGEFVDPEPAHDPASHEMRDRLLRALEPGRDAFPRDAARAQADYDCWIMNVAVPSQSGAAAQCKKSLDVTLPLLESETKTGPGTPGTLPAMAGAEPAATPPPVGSAEPAPPPAAQPAAAATPPPKQIGPNTYTVYFDFDSWSLNAQQMNLLNQMAAKLRDVPTAKIAVTGHADTSGPDAYNEELSVKRAKMVADLIVNLGVKRELIATEGTGETDLAVPTPDGVREPKNRRAVLIITP